MTPLSIQATWDHFTKLLEAAELTYGHGAINASSEALWMISSALGFPPEDTLESLDDVIDVTTLERLESWCNERIQTRKPLAYIIGEAWLMGVPFYCDDRSIVPRSFVAELIVDGHLEPWLPPDAKVLDLCTGNGSLAILMALACPDTQVSGADISYPALSLAAKNIDRHGLSNQIQLFQGDLWDALPNDSESTFDLILCNPPYVNEQSMRSLPQEYLAEPSLALAGGQDGMDIIRRIVDGLANHLKPEGALVLEIGNEAQHFRQAFPDLEITWLPVSAGDDQVLLITKDRLGN